MAAYALVFVTIAAAVVCWAIGEALRSRAAWTAGAVLTLVHSVAAFGVFYGWSHEIARIMTARQTAEATGIDFAGGIYVNYVVRCGLASRRLLVVRISPSATPSGRA